MAKKVNIPLDGDSITKKIIKCIRKLKGVGLEGSVRWFDVAELPYLELYLDCGMPGWSKSKEYRHQSVVAISWLRKKLLDMVRAGKLDRMVVLENKISRDPIVTVKKKSLYKLK